MLNSLLSSVPDYKRIYTIENGARELSLIKRDVSGRIINNVVHTLSRPSDKKESNITQEDLVVTSLRFDPDIICIGEMRDSEASSAIEASSTDHTVVTTVHGDGGRRAHRRIAFLAQKAEAKNEVGILMEQAALAFPIVVFVHKLANNARKVMEITECVVHDNVCLGETEVFHLGMLGPVGCFVFLFSASFGQIDGLGDDRNPRMRRFRLIPLIFPTLYIGLYVLDILSPVHLSVKIIHTFLLLLIAATVYYNFKHLIIPDVTYGIFKSMRKYNLLVLCISALFTVRVLFSDYGINMAENIIVLLLAATFLLLLPITAKGVQKWYT